MASMERVGFLDRYPVAVVPTEGGYRGFDGRHRWEAAKRLGLEKIPVQVYERIAPDDE